MRVNVTYYVKNAILASEQYHDLLGLDPETLEDMVKFNLGLSLAPVNPQTDLLTLELLDCAVSLIDWVELATDLGWDE